MANARWRDYLEHPHEFDGWLKASAVVGSVLPIGLLAVVLAGLYSPGPSSLATEFSSRNRAPCQTTKPHVLTAVSSTRRSWQAVCGRMVRLNDSELAQLFDATMQLPQTMRYEFLAEVAKALEGKDVGDGEFRRLVSTATSVRR
ncbi:MAG TPA: hypothetical protein VH934_18550 [Xanthobacteraceae bacterium]